MLPILVRLLASTWRVTWHGPGLTGLQRNGPAILTLWHGRMLAAMPLRGHRHGRRVVLVSPSGDGELVVGALAHFGYQPVRGSTSRRAARALRDLAAALAAGRQVVLTPDGPRGPRHAMNVGPCWLARETQSPILGLGIAVDRAWRLRSWDGFVIPKPFARLAVHYAEPLAVQPQAGDAELERCAAALRARMLAAETAAWSALGLNPDWSAPSADPAEPDPEQ